MLTFRLGNARELFMALPKVKKQTKRQKRHLLYGQMEMGYAVIKKPSK